MEREEEGLTCIKVAEIISLHACTKGLKQGCRIEF